MTLEGILPSRSSTTSLTFFAVFKISVAEFAVLLLFLASIFNDCKTVFVFERAVERTVGVERIVEVERIVGVERIVVVVERIVAVAVEVDTAVVVAVDTAVVVAVDTAVVALYQFESALVVAELGLVGKVLVGKVLVAVEGRLKEQEKIQRRKVTILPSK